MAGPFELVFGQAGLPAVVLSVEAMLGPVLLLVLLAALANAFQPALMEGEVGQAGGGRARPAAARRRWLPLIARLATGDPVERGAFELVWHLSGRDRHYKLRVYPSIAFTFIFAFMLLFVDAGRGLTNAMAELHQTNKHLLLLYFASTLAPASLIQLRFSSQFEAAWIYSALPLRRPGEILSGAMKTIIVRLMLPTFLLLVVLTLAIWGWRVLPDIVLASAVTLLACVIEGLLIARRLPFSESAGALEDSGRSLRGLFLLLIVGILAGVHYAIRPYPAVVWGAVPVVLVATFGFMRLYRATSWAAVR